MRLICGHSNRRVDNKLNVFESVHRNLYFICIFFFIISGQILIVHFGGWKFKVARLNWVEWAISVSAGLLSLAIGAVLRKTPDRWVSFLLRQFNPFDRWLTCKRKKKGRVARDGSVQTQEGSLGA